MGITESNITFIMTSIKHFHSNNQSQKVRITWLILFTMIIDLVWLIYWGSFWNSKEFTPGYWENGVHTFTIILSSINLFLKVTDHCY